jgi:DNA-binding transcriptional LysR family regulator
MEYIDSLRIFRTVVEAKSFTRAAEILGLTTPVVSRAIAALEKRLGSRLFHRTTRQISLTEAAERFYDGCCRVLDDLDALEASASTQSVEPSGVLRLVAHTTATINRLVPLIASFKRKHPKVDLDVTMTERPVDLVADGFDLGIVLPFMLSTDTVVTRVLERIPIAIVASPRYLETHPAPRHPSELRDHLFVTSPPSVRKPALTFKVEGVDLTIPLKYEIASNSAVFNRQMVLEGFGVGAIATALVQAELDSGQLVRLVEDFEIVNGAVEIRLAYSTRTLQPAKVRAFIDHAAAFFDEIETAQGERAAQQA